MASQTAIPAPQTPPKQGHRSKNGCKTCRIRKLKCDEQWPLCGRCAKAQIQCKWLEPGRSLSRRSHGEASPSSASSGTALRRLAPARVVSTATTPADTGTEASFSEAAASPASSVLQPRQTDLGNPRPALSTVHIPLSNSLQLSAEDQECFLHIPDSVLVLRFGKPWKWSSFSWVYTHIASRYSGVMRIYIAGAAMELRSKEILAAQEGDNPPARLQRARSLEESATNHYHLALKDLSSVLDPFSRSTAGNDDVDALFSMWFLILHFGLYDSQSMGASHVHLDGIRSFLKPYLESWKESGQKSLPLVSQQLLLFISYLDINFALGNANGGRLWLDLVSTATESQNSHDRLFHVARSCHSKIWGAQYPTSELLDDMENYRPLHFMHLCQRPKLDILSLATAANHGQVDEYGRQRICQRVKEIGEQFADVLTLAGKVPNSGGRRLMWTVYHASLEYYALQVLCSCLGSADHSPSDLDALMAQASSIAYKAIGEDERQIYRLAWPLCVTLLKTRDLIHQDWLRRQLKRAIILLPNFGIPGPALDGEGYLGGLFIASDRARLIEPAGPRYPEMALLAE